MRHIHLVILQILIYFVDFFVQVIKFNLRVRSRRRNFWNFLVDRWLCEHLKLLLPHFGILNLSANFISKFYELFIFLETRNFQSYLFFFWRIYRFFRFTARNNLNVWFCCYLSFRSSSNKLIPIYNLLHHLIKISSLWTELIMVLLWSHIALPKVFGSIYLYIVASASKWGSWATHAQEFLYLVDICFHL